LKSKLNSPIHSASCFSSELSITVLSVCPIYALQELMVLEKCVRFLYFQVILLSFLPTCTTVASWIALVMSKSPPPPPARLRILRHLSSRKLPGLLLGGWPCKSGGRLLVRPRIATKFRFWPRSQICENPCSRSRFVPVGQKDGTAMSKPVVALVKNGKKWALLQFSVNKLLWNLFIISFITEIMLVLN
jgi:hypothetical protein